MSEGQMIDIGVILEDLKDGKSPRTRKSLDTLNSILESYAKEGNLDFSITQIGRVSAAGNGPGYESIRATKNKHYRDLIEAWAAKCKTTTKKPLSKHSRSNKVPQDNQLLERIPDPAVRALFGQIIAERNRYRKELHLAKQHANVVVDRRPVNQYDTQKEEDAVQLLPSLSGLLNRFEKEALAFAISDDCMQRHNWEYTKAGQVKEKEYNTEIFPRGFVTGLRKILGEVDDA